MKVFRNSANRAEGGAPGARKIFGPGTARGGAEGERFGQGRGQGLGAGGRHR